MESQSLVNQGRFPQAEKYYSGVIFAIRKSQSLVNQGRFPQISLDEAKEILRENSLSQSLVNQGRFPQTIDLSSNPFSSSRNPSLIRAGFHKRIVIEVEEEEYLSRNPSLIRAGFHRRCKDAWKVF